MQRFWAFKTAKLLDAPWVLSKEEKSVLRKVIETLCTPIRTMHSLKGSFVSAREKHLSGFKAHYWNNMRQGHDSTSSGISGSCQRDQIALSNAIPVRATLLNGR